MPEICLKHSLSNASDALVRYEIDSLGKYVEIAEMKANSGREFISLQLLNAFVEHLERTAGFVLYDNEDTDSWAVTRSPWEIYLTASGQRYRVRVTKLIMKQGFEVQLFPVLPKGSAT